MRPALSTFSAMPLNMAYGILMAIALDVAAIDGMSKWGSLQRHGSEGVIRTKLR